MKPPNPPPPTHVPTTGTPAAPVSAWPLRVWTLIDDCNGHVYRSAVPCTGDCTRVPPPCRLMHRCSPPPV
eukprot:5028739-Prymnesium_polylepis.1